MKRLYTFLTSFIRITIISVFIYFIVVGLAYLITDQLFLGGYSTIGFALFYIPITAYRMSKVTVIIEVKYVEQYKNTIIDIYKQKRKIIKSDDILTILPPLSTKGFAYKTVITFKQKHIVITGSRLYIHPLINNPALSNLQSKVIL